MTKNDTGTNITGTLAQIETLAQHFPPLDEAQKIKNHLCPQRYGATSFNLHVLGDWFRAVKGRKVSTLHRPRIALFASGYGMATDIETHQITEKLRSISQNQAPVNRLALLADCELKLYEMALDQLTDIPLDKDAMSEQTCVKAIAYGMTAVEDDVDLLCLDTLHPTANRAGSSLAALTFGGPPARFFDPKDWAIFNKDILKKHPKMSPLLALRSVGGFDIAAMTGAILAARTARIPVFIGSYTGLVAASIVGSMAPDALSHILITKTFSFPYEQTLLKKLGERSFVPWGLKESPGVASTALVSLLRASLAL